MRRIVGPSLISETKGGELIEGYTITLIEKDGLPWVEIRFHAFAVHIPLKQIGSLARDLLKADLDWNDKISTALDRIKT